MVGVKGVSPIYVLSVASIFLSFSSNHGTTFFPLTMVTAPATIHWFFLYLPFFSYPDPIFGLRELQYS